MQWVRTHAAKDSTYGMAWLMEDAFIDSGDTSRYLSHLWGNEVTYIRATVPNLLTHWILGSNAMAMALATTMLRSHFRLF
jgi:hypothetical protein